MKWRTDCTSRCLRDLLRKFSRSRLGCGGRYREALLLQRCQQVFPMSLNFDGKGAEALALTCVHACVRDMALPCRGDVVRRCLRRCSLLRLAKRHQTPANAVVALPCRGGVAMRCLRRCSPLRLARRQTLLCQCEASPHTMRYIRDRLKDGSRRLLFLSGCR